MSQALKVLLASLNAFNTLAPSAGQVIAVFRKPDGEEIPLLEMIDGVVTKNDVNIATAEEYLATHPAE
jgi:hypothetical protein